MKTDDNRHPLTCSNPLQPEILADYWLAVLPQSDEEVVEEHLLSCDECGSRLRELIALAEAVRKLAQEGSLRMIVSDKYVAQAARAGLRIREYAPPAGGRVECTVTPADDLLIGRLTADLSEAKRVDLCLCNERGIEQLRMADIPVHSGANSIVYQESITYAKAAQVENTMIARLVSVDEAGTERLLGEYTFHHTPHA